MLVRCLDMGGCCSGYLSVFPDVRQVAEDKSPTPISTPSRRIHCERDRLFALQSIPAGTDNRFRFCATPFFA